MEHSARLARERDFHNRHFLKEEQSRVAQNKYYFAIFDGLHAYHELVLACSRGRDVLEYGCGAGTLTRAIAARSKSAMGIDLSDAAVSRARELCAKEGIQNASFATMDAEEMGFAEGSFDFVFGSAIVHHLDVVRAMSEVHRVLRRGGRALFVEPLGHNPIFNFYRWITPTKRTEDEHPLKRSDIETIRLLFPDVRLHYFGLLTLLSVPLQSTKVGIVFRSGLRRIDEMLCRLGLQWHCWYVLIDARKS